MPDGFEPFLFSILRELHLFANSVLILKVERYAVHGRGLSLVKQESFASLSAGCSLLSAIGVAHHPVSLVSALLSVSQIT
jgi:hypothetical protein